MLKIKKLEFDKYFIQVRELFKNTFSKEPWYDDWSNQNQLNLYIKDIMGSFNSLNFGLYLGEELIGLALGKIAHFYSGNQFRVDEICIKYEYQKFGYGSLFMSMLEKECKKAEIKYIILTTKRNYPAYNFYLKNGFVEVKNDVNLAKEIDLK